MFRNHHGRRRRMPLSPSGLQMFRTPTESYKRQRHALHVEVRKGALLPSGYLSKHLNGLSPTDGWTIGMYEPMAQTIPEVLDQPQTNQLVHVLVCSGICAQHMVQCHHKNIPISPAHGIRPACHLGDNEVTATPN